MAQNFTSRATAVNGKAGKLPAIYNKINIEGLCILDIGCGAYTDHINAYVTAECGYWYGIDPFNQTGYHNIRTLAVWDVVNGIAENCNLVISSNVLNVIDNDEAVQDAVNDIVDKSALGSYAVTVYEGDKSGHGRQTGVDQWQRNQKLREYLKYFPADAVIRKGVITNAPELVK